MTLCAGCLSERKAHPTAGCRKYRAPSLTHVPLTCAYGCEKPVLRADLEFHARSVHGAKLARTKPKSKSLWLAGEPRTPEQKREARPA